MIQPIGDRVLIEQEVFTSNVSGILIPTDNGEQLKYPRGKVVEVGTDCSITDLKGSTVLFGEMAGEKLEYDGKEYLVLKTSEILAKIC